MKISFALFIGICLGAAGTGIYIHHCFHEAHARQGDFNPFLNRLSVNLKLTPAQTETIRGIFNDFRSQLESARLDTNTKLKSLRDASNDKIRAVLNDEQKQKFNQMIAKWESRHSDPKGWNVPGAVPPPPWGPCSSMTTRLRRTRNPNPPEGNQA